MNINNNLHLLPMNSENNILILREYRHLLQTSISPRGSSKIIVTGGGHVEVTSSSAQLLRRLELQNPLCRLIAQTLPDHGCVFGVLVTHLLEQFYTCPSISANKFSKSVFIIIQELKKLLTLKHICRRVDFTTIHNSFIPFVRTIVTSKYTSCWSKNYIENLCVEIIKVFLNTVDYETNAIGKVYIEMEKPVDNFVSYNGLLCYIEHDFVKNIAKIGNEIRIIIITMKIEDKSGGTLMTKSSQIIPILLEAIKMGVKIIAYQKYVSPEIKLFLLRRNILFVERMGTEMTSLLVHMSQALPISTHNVDLCKLDKMIGNLSSVEHILLNCQDYVLFTVNYCCVGTLLIPNINPGGAYILKKLTQQAVDMLKVFVTHPFLTFGAGCLETWIIAQLEILKGNWPGHKIQVVACWIQRALLSACGKSPPERLDSVHHHGWSQEDHCRCGAVSASMAHQTSSHYIFLSEIINSKLPLKLVPPQQPSIDFYGRVFCDSHHQKVNVILSALEMCINLCDIGLFVYTE